MLSTACSRVFSPDRRPSALPDGSMPSGVCGAAHRGTMLEAISRNFGLKTVAVVIGVILWFTFNYLTAGETKYSKTLVVPVSVQHVSSGLVASTNVRQVTIELSGSRTRLDGLAPDDFTAFVDGSGKAPGTYALEISLRGDGTDTIKSVTPASA